jgi:hypothetical protein
MLTKLLSDDVTAIFVALYSSLFGGISFLFGIAALVVFATGGFVSGGILLVLGLLIFGGLLLALAYRAIKEI